jgi:hypothetical protein
MFWNIFGTQKGGRRRILEPDMYNFHLHPWIWRQYVSPKSWHLLTGLHGAKIHKNNIRWQSVAVFVFYAHGINLRQLLCNPKYKDKEMVSHCKVIL